MRAFILDLPILTSSETKKVEKITASLKKLSESQMIVQAGFAVYNAILKFLVEQPSTQKRPWVILCGKGHNGADGLQCGIYAIEADISVQIYQIFSETGYSPETMALQNQIQSNGVEIINIKSTTDFNPPIDSRIIIDGLLGSGLTSEPRPLIKKLINKVNQLPIPVFSIDVPSGISSDVSFLSNGVKADATLSLGGANVSSLFYPTLEYYGKTTYSTLCFPPDVINQQKSKTFLFQTKEVPRIYPLPEPHAYKHKAGKVLIIAGSKGMHGAALMAASGALKTGAGLVKLAIPGGAYKEAGKRLTEVIGIPIGGAHANCFHENHFAEFKELIKWCDVIIAGPGISRDKHSLELIKQIIEKCAKPLILDGDGLGCYFGQRFPKRKSPKPILVTPHQGEYTKMKGKFHAEDPWLHINKAQTFAQKKKLHLVLKGPSTLYTDPNGSCTLLPRGTPGLATAGTGDILSGILGALLCKLPPKDCVKMGVTLHSLAGIKAAKKKGTRGMIATDIIKYIPSILADWEKEVKRNFIRK